VTQQPGQTDHSSDAAPQTFEFSTRGVGPWIGDWPEDSRYDPELLHHGDTRNVIDRYRYWRMEAIVADLDGHRHPFHVAIENWQHDMNIGSIVRSANAFAADTVHIVGRKRWNKRGAMVTDRYQHVVHHDTIAALTLWAQREQIPIIGIDNVPVR
jgi:tRNA G18 (ribose-2'-O)-methylase SpoU